MTPNRTQNTYTGKEFVISRTFNAPRDIVFEAWTEPESLKQWFGPKGFKGVYAKMDFRPGGMYHYAIQGPDGMKIWGRMMYKEIQAPEKIVFINSFSDEKGGLTRHPLSPDWPIEMLTVYDFKESNGKTTVTIHWSPLNPTEAERKTFQNGFDSMTQGWTGTFEQFEEYLKSR